MIQRWSIGGIVDPKQVSHDLASLVVREMNEAGCELRQHQVRRVLHTMEQLRKATEGQNQRGWREILLQNGRKHRGMGFSPTAILYGIWSPMFDRTRPPK